MASPEISFLWLVLFITGNGMTVMMNLMLSVSHIPVGAAGSGRVETHGLGVVDA